MNQNRGREAIPVGRFSSDEQKNGNSVLRQNNSFERVCQRWELTPSTQWKIFDQGTSGYHGDHLDEKAELGKFLKALRSKQINPDDMGRMPVLVWESVDRMTRLPQLKATSLVTELTSAGIALVFDESEIWIDETSVKDRYMNLATLIDASFQFSRRLSRRQKSVWDAKRGAIGSHIPIKMRLPSWIDFDITNKKFVLNAGAADAIRYIFQQTADGTGQRQLVHKMQRSQFTPIGTSGKWNGSYIQSILSDRTVLGEFQPYQFAPNRERVTVGSPIAGYYPAVIDESLWYRAQASKCRRTKLKGPNSQFINLFAGLVCNGNDNHPMHVQTTRAERNNSKYVQRRLVSYGSRNKLVGSCSISIKYSAFENAILMSLSELSNVDQNDQDIEHLSRLKKVEDELAGVNGRLNDLQLLLEDENVGITKALLLSISTTEKRQASLMDEINAIKIELSTSKNLKKSKSEFDAFCKDSTSGSSSIYNQLARQQFPIYFTKQQIATLNKPALVKIHVAHGEELHSLRLHYQDLINRLVKGITVWPVKNEKKVGFIAQLKLHNGVTRSISYCSGRYQFILPRVGEKVDPDRAIQILLSELKKQLAQEAEPEIKKEIIADSLNNAAEIWLDEIRRKMTKQSFRVIPSKITRFVAYLGVDLDPHEINKGRWDQWVIWLRGEVECNRMKIATARVCYSRSRELLRWLQERGFTANIEGLELSAARAMTINSA